MSDATKDTKGTGDHRTYDPSRHDNQIVAVFEDRRAAAKARDALLNAGIPEGAIELVGHGEDDAPAGVERRADGQAAEQSVGDSVLSAFMSLFSTEDDHRSFVHAVDRGHAMLVVLPSGEADRRTIIETLESCDPIDFDAKLAEWQQAGNGGSANVPAPEPERRIGRREEAPGARRVRSYVADRPSDGMGTGGDVTNPTPGGVSRR